MLPQVDMVEDGVDRCAYHGLFLVQRHSTRLTDQLVGRPSQTKISWEMQAIQGFEDIKGVHHDLPKSYRAHPTLSQHFLDLDDKLAVYRLHFLSYYEPQKMTSQNNSHQMPGNNHSLNHQATYDQEHGKYIVC